MICRPKRLLGDPHVVGERCPGQRSRRDALNEPVLQRGLGDDSVPLPQRIGKRGHGASLSKAAVNPPTRHIPAAHPRSTSTTGASGWAGTAAMNVGDLRVERPDLAVIGKLRRRRSLCAEEVACARGRTIGC
jgi:hypothetical protein